MEEYIRILIFNAIISYYALATIVVLGYIAIIVIAGWCILDLTSNIVNNS